jgi:hypothetical protein
MKFGPKPPVALMHRRIMGVVPGKVCRIGFGLLPGAEATAVQLSRYEAQAKGPNAISQSDA